MNRRYQIISDDKRAAIRKYAATHSQKDTAAAFSVSHSSVSVIMNTPLIKRQPRTPSKPNPIICSTFGCGRTLSKTEQLYGNKCINHSKKYIV